MTGEYVAQMLPMLVVAAVSVAWLAEQVLITARRSYGFLPDMALACAGSVFTGALAWAIFAPAGMVGMFAIGAAGAGLALATQRGWWPAVEVRR